jgi:signal transduction histidine kinase
MTTMAAVERKFDLEHGPVHARRALDRYGVAVAAIGVAFLIRYLLSPTLGDELPFMFSVAAILFAAWYGGWGPGLTALFLGTLVGIYFMVDESGTTKVTGRVDELRIVRYLITAILGIIVVEALHRSKRQVHAASEQIARHAELLQEEVGERKRSETALEQARAQLSTYAADLEQRVNERTAELQESVEALEGVLYHVAHDLRAPLRAMEGFTSLMLKEHAGELDVDVADYARRVSEAACRMDQLLRGLLEYGRLAQMEMRCGRVNLEQATASVLKRLEPAIKGASASITVKGPPPEVWANAEVLELILLHVIKNAVTFVKPWATPEVRIWAERCAGKVCLWVEDNGIGIEPEYHNRIFWMFERLHSTYPGTGIGLAIVAKGMQRMGGKVGVESIPDQGAKFWLDLPLPPDDTRDHSGAPCVRTNEIA